MAPAASNVVTKCVVSDRSSTRLARGVPRRPTVELREAHAAKHGAVDAVVDGVGAPDGRAAGRGSIPGVDAVGKPDGARRDAVVAEARWPCPADCVVGRWIRNRWDKVAGRTGSSLAETREENHWSPDKSTSVERREAVIGFPQFSREQIQVGFDVFSVLVRLKFLPLRVPFVSTERLWKAYRFSRGGSSRR